MTNHVLLNSVDHKSLKIRQDYGAELGDNLMWTPTFFSEFKAIQAHYPIVFKKQEGEDAFISVALLGLEQNENLFLTNNIWDASYVPMMIQRIPFSIGLYDDESSSAKKRMLHIDLDHPRVVSDSSAGQTLFREDGSITDYLERASGILEAIHRSHDSHRAFVQKLNELNLLESVNMDIRLGDGSEGQLLGFHTINEKNLANLTREQLGELHCKGWLEAIFMAVASLAKMQALVERKSRKAER